MIVNVVSKQKIMNTGSKQTTIRSGFTLIELLVVIAIIAVMAAMLLPALAFKKRAFLVFRKGFTLIELFVVAARKSVLHAFLRKKPKQEIFLFRRRRLKGDFALGAISFHHPTNSIAGIPVTLRASCS